MTTNYQTGSTGTSGNDLKEKIKQDANMLKQEASTLKDDVNTLKQDVSAKARDLKQDVTEKARDVSRQFADKGREKAESLTAKAADTLQDVEAAAEAEAEALEDLGWDNLSGYVREMADGIGGLSENLRNKSVDELVHSAAQLARNNTALFMVGAVAIGFGLSRFAKAAPRTRAADSDTWQGSDEFRRNDAYSYPGGENSAYARPDSSSASGSPSEEIRPYGTPPGDENRPYESH